MLQKQQPKVQLGAAGEARAIEFLQSKGFQVLDTNVQIGHAEIDIVALDPKFEELVFIEVKTRHQDFSGHPSSAVNRTKLRAMTQAARAYRTRRHLTTDFRFDIISVLPHSIDHAENITWGMVK